MVPLFPGKSQHFRKAEPRRVPTSFGQHQALHSGNRSRSLLPKQSKTVKHPQRRGLLVGSARSQVKKSYQNFSSPNLISENWWKMIL